jgi:hypothetical protein
MFEINHTQPAFYDETPICYFQTSTGQRLNLTKLCTQGAILRGTMPDARRPEAFNQTQFSN